MLRVDRERREGKGLSEKWKETAWEVGKHVLLQFVWLTEWLRSVPNEGQVSFVVPLAHPLFSMCPEAGDLNTCKRASQLWFPGCLEAAACSPSSKKRGEQYLYLNCDGLQLQRPHLSKEARAKSEPKPDPCSHKITPGSFFYLFYLPVALL